MITAVCLQLSTFIFSSAAFCAFSSSDKTFWLFFASPAFEGGSDLDLLTISGEAFLGLLGRSRPCCLGAEPAL